MKAKRKFFIVAAILVVAFLSMAGNNSCQIRGTDWFCYWNTDKGGDLTSFNCYNGK